MKSNSLRGRAFQEYTILQEPVQFRLHSNCSFLLFTLLIHLALLNIPVIGTGATPGKFV